MQKSIYSREQKCLQGLLRTLRVDAGLTQTAMAARLKLPQSFVSKYESGERMLDFVEIRNVCKHLGISLAEFAKRFERELNNEAR
ncbi:MAG TPA: helix-turn-helix transcriptional regulator [Candidatus Paceibacterota bacterium]|nr:helix-turn-helix transcriptional regulator [Verrucomicrobiota bacterium]HSA11574.1 helix-turn-helix transcriptional regulator [Candidatus Paceibacterota bacterium]